MRRHSIVFVLIGFFSFLGNSLMADEIIDPAVFRVMLNNCGPQGGGFVQTGFRAGWNGHEGIVTALHGVSGCDGYYATQGEIIYLTDLKLAAVDVDRDVAFLSSRQIASVPGVPLHKAKYNIGKDQKDQLKVVGYPDGVLSQISNELRYHENPLRPLSNLHSVVVNMCEKRKSPKCNTMVLLVAGEPLIPGDSGAPIFNQDHQVIGIADGGLKGGLALVNWIIPYVDVHLISKNQAASMLNFLRHQDFTQLFAIPSTLSQSKYPQKHGAEVTGRILYGGYNGSPIGTVAEYSKANAVIQLWDRESESPKEVPVDFAYDNRTGVYSIKNVPVGKFAINVRIESGYPFFRESGGDFVSYLSGLNEDLIIAPHDNIISRDLKVVYSIHLKRPVDNQQTRTMTSDPPEIISRHENIFEWDPVPGASYYEVYLYLHDVGTNSTNLLVNPYKTKLTRYQADLKATRANTYYMFRVAAYDSQGSLLGDFSNYYKNGFGGWFNFITLPALAQDKTAIDKAERFYNQGIAAYNGQHWPDAAWNFEQSFQVIPHSMTAYMLGATYIKLEKPAKALYWAETATSSKPDLQEPYISGARQIKNWARPAQNDPYYISGKADEINRTPAPKFKPPWPPVPHTSMNIAPPSPHRAPPAHGNSTQHLIPVQPIPGAGQSDLQIRNVSISPNPLVQSQIQLHMYRSYRLQASILNSGASSPAFVVVRTECNRNGIHYKLGETHVKPILKNQTRDVFYDIFPGEAGAGDCLMRTAVDADQQVNESDESPLSNSWDRAVTVLP